MGLMLPMRVVIFTSPNMETDNMEYVTRHLFIEDVIFSPILDICSFPQLNVTNLCNSGNVKILMYCMDIARTLCLYNCESTASLCLLITHFVTTSSILLLKPHCEESRVREREK